MKCRFCQKHNCEKQRKHYDDVFIWFVAHIIWKQDLIKCDNRKNLRYINADGFHNVFDCLIQNLVNFHFKYFWQNARKINFFQRKFRLKTCGFILMTNYGFVLNIYLFVHFIKNAIKPAKFGLFSWVLYIIKSLRFHILQLIFI